MSLWVLAFLIYGVFSQAVFSDIFPLHRSIFLVALLSVVVPLILFSARLPASAIALSLGVLLSGFLLFLYWGNPRYVAYGAYLIGAILLVVSARLAWVKHLVTFLTGFFSVVLVGGWGAVVLHAVGVGPLYTAPFLGADERTAFFFYTSFTNIDTGSYIRPSGIFDEPGSLSFYVCFLAILRHFLDRNKKVTWFLLILGLVTASLAHVIYMVIHFLADFRFRQGLRSARVVVGFVVVGVVFSLFMASPMGKELVSRFGVGQDDRLIAGDNRGPRFKGAVTAIADNGWEAVAFGIPMCMYDGVECRQKYGKINVNPAWPIAQKGIVGSWPYYALLSWLIVAGVAGGRAQWVLVGAALLLLQRPYLFYEGYSALLLLMVVVYLRYRIMTRT
ncbi:hypothetical protein [Thioalkalivibrio sp. ALE30]|uniref:hypothetical protein n=1 Tax=Thioalkalivibrio sp. ALE30 TaxID=1158181 RepID=UPI0018CAC297|nr:hypothetical protein [Thioalkalivibrio sp. ALE30]